MSRSPTVSVLFQKALSTLEQNSATLPSENNDSNSPPSSPRKNTTSDGDSSNLDTVISQAVPEPREIGGMIAAALMLGGFMLVATIYDYSCLNFLYCSNK